MPKRTAPGAVPTAPSGDWDKALSDFTEAIKREPDYGKAYLHRGVAYVEKKELDKAIADYSEAIRLTPKVAHVAYYKRAHAYEKKGDYDKAIADYSKSILFRPETRRWVS